MPDTAATAALRYDHIALYERDTAQCEDDYVDAAQQDDARAPAR